MFQKRFMLHRILLRETLLETFMKHQFSLNQAVKYKFIDKTDVWFFM